MTARVSATTLPRMVDRMRWVRGSGLALLVVSGVFGCLQAGRAPRYEAADVPSASAEPAATTSASAKASAAAPSPAAAPAPAPPPAIADASSLQKTCDGGDGAACRTLAQGYASGSGVNKDELKAALLFEKACAKNLADACFRAADLRFSPGADLGDTNKKGSLKSDKLAADDANKGCAAGSAAACGLYGRMELYGRTPNSDRKHAFDLLDKVCNSSEPPSVMGPACNMLGYAYETGSGVAADIVKARSLYEKSCNLEHAAGCGRLGDLYVTGQGGEKNPKKAAELYQKACKAGVYESCDALKDLK